MKKESEIRQKLKQLKFRAKKKNIKESIRRDPSNCMHHAVESFSNGKTVGLCKYGNVKEDGEDWYISVCDEETDEGFEQARNCAKFRPIRTVDSIKEEFDCMIESSRDNIGYLALYYPDIAALSWVLDEAKSNVDRLIPSDEVGDEEFEEPIEGHGESEGLKEPERISEIRELTTEEFTIEEPEIEEYREFAVEGPKEPEKLTKNQHIDANFISVISFIIISFTFMITVTLFDIPDYLLKFFMHSVLFLSSVVIIISIFSYIKKGKRD